MKKLSKLRKELLELREEKSFLCNKYQDTMHVIYPKELQENDILIHQKKSQINEEEKKVYIKSNSQ